MAKYVIEIEDEPFGRNDDPVIPHGMDELYRAKGFKSLVFDKNGLDKLTPYTEPDEDEIRHKVENEVWEFEKALYGLSDEGLYEIFPNGCPYEMSYQEAKAKYEEWLKQKDEIHVGDEVTICGQKRVVTSIDDEDTMAIDSDGNTYSFRSIGFYDEATKTGRHFPEVAELLKKMREE